jgi:hypothetical protein
MGLSSNIAFSAECAIETQPLRRGIGEKCNELWAAAVVSAKWESMLRYLDQPVAKLIAEEDFSQLLQELSEASGVDYRDCVTLHFLPFLDFCMHPTGAGSPRVLLHPHQTRPGYLETKIEKLDSSVILELCQELAAVIRESLEMHMNRRLMTFFNHVVRRVHAQSKRPKRRR